MSTMRYMIIRSLGLRRMIHARMSEFYMTKVAHGGDRRYAQRNEGGRAHRCSAALSPSPRPSSFQAKRRVDVKEPGDEPVSTQTDSSVPKLAAPQAAHSRMMSNKTVVTNADKTQIIPKRAGTTAGVRGGVWSACKSISLQKWRRRSVDPPQAGPVGTASRRGCETPMPMYLQAGRSPSHEPRDREIYGDMRYMEILLASAARHRRSDIAARSRP